MEKPQKISGITAARLPGRPINTLWDIGIEHDCISSIEEHDDSANHVDYIHAHGGLCTSSFCHAHVHLDKCFILSDPAFSDLEVVKGDFAEAMDLTGQAKARFTEEDLLRRGRRLIEESVQYGVTHMRAFVEVDEVVGMKCIDAAIHLQKEFVDRCDVRICAFAQLALFSSDAATHRRHLLVEAMKYAEVEVIGSTPYVEEDDGKACENITWTTSMAMKYDKHLDFHLDYNLDTSQTTLTAQVIGELHSRQWAQWAEAQDDKVVTLGHCTQLTMASSDSWAEIKRMMADLPVNFVGLPTSDLFIMGRSSANPRRDPHKHPHTKPRGTLQVVDMINDCGFNCAISMNNIGNGFTPYGSCNPLRLASLGVGIYHAGAKKDVETLFETVTNRAKSAIGLCTGSMQVCVGDDADLLIFDSPDTGRGPSSIYEAVTLPDAATLRASLYEGSVVHRGRT